MRRKPSHATDAGAGGVNCASAVAAKPACAGRSMTLRGGRADTGLQLKRAVAGNRIAGVLCPAQDCEDILDVSGFEELEPAIFDERDVAPPKLDLKKVAVMSGGSGASRWWKLGWRLRWPWVKRPG